MTGRFAPRMLFLTSKIGLLKKRKLDSNPRYDPDNVCFYHKWQLHYVWFLWYGAWMNRFFCHFEAIFGLSTRWQPRKSKLWKNEKKKIIILHMFNINDDHMIYGSWDMERNVQNFFFFHSGLFFIVLTPTHPPPAPRFPPLP